MNASNRKRDEGVNRRRFYRIDDEIILKYQELSAGPADGRHVDNGERIEIAFLVCSRMAEYRRRMQTLFSQARRESPATAKLLGLLDEKTDLLANLLLQDDFDAMADYRRRVQLSASGMAFRTHEGFQSNAVLALQMILLPSLVGVTTEGRVVRSKEYLREVDGCLYETTVEFQNLKESTRDLIAKHVFCKKAEHVRRKRQ